MIFAGLPLNQRRFDGAASQSLSAWRRNWSRTCPLTERGSFSFNIFLCSKIQLHYETTTQRFFVLHVARKKNSIPLIYVMLCATILDELKRNIIVIFTFKCYFIYIKSNFCDTGTGREIWKRFECQIFYLDLEKSCCMVLFSTVMYLDSIIDTSSPLRFRGSYGIDL